MRLLLRAYPRRWRERYGEELVALLEAEPLTWRVCLDVVAAAFGERLRGSGPPQLRVLWAWSVFVIGGVGFQKTSEHWQLVVPQSQRALPAAAFDTVVVAAAVGSAAVLAGVLLAVPALLRDLRSGGWPAVRRPIVVAVSVTVVAAAALLSLTLHHDVVAASLFAAFALISLIAWTYAAAVAARRLTLLRAHSRLAILVTSAMVVMTAAAAVWFWNVTIHAPSFVGSAQLALVATLMAGATALAAIGTFNSLRA